MKSNVPYIIVILILLFLAGWFYMELQEVKASDERKDTVIAEKNAEIKYRENEKGQIVAEKNAAIVSKKELEDAYPKIAEEIKNDFDLKLKNIRAFIKNEFEVRGKGTGTITNNHYFDSTSRKTVRFRDFKMNDGFLKFETKLFDSLTTSQYNYVYTDTASTAIHGKKNWVFGKERLYATTIFRNPDAKIIGTTNILVQDHKDKRISIGPGLMYDPFSNRFVVGIGVTYSLIKF